MAATVVANAVDVAVVVTVDAPYVAVASHLLLNELAPIAHPKPTPQDCTTFTHFQVKATCWRLSATSPGWCAAFTS